MDHRESSGSDPTTMWSRCHRAAPVGSRSMGSSTKPKKKEQLARPLGSARWGALVSCRTWLFSHGAREGRDSVVKQVVQGAKRGRTVHDAKFNRFF